MSIKKYIQKIENKYISFRVILLSIFIIAFLRNIIEHVLKHNSFYAANDYLITINAYFFHFNFFWFAVFFFQVITLYLFVRKKVGIKKVINVCLMFFPIILLPPIFDLLIGNTEPMAYPDNPLTFFSTTINFLNPKVTFYGITHGMRLEILIICIAFGYYVFLKRKNLFISVIAFLVGYLGIMFHGFWVSLISQLYEFGINFNNSFELSNSKLLKDGLILRNGGKKFSTIYILLFTLYLSIVLFFYNKKKFKSLISNFRLYRVIHYFILLFAGLIIGKKLYLNIFFHEKNILKIFEISNPFEIVGIFSIFISLFFSFQSAVIFNDIADIKIDKISNPNRPLINKIFEIKEYFYYGLLFLFISLSLAYNVNLTFFILIIFYNGLAFLYSNKPFRLKKHLLTSCIILGFVALLSFFLGISAYNEQYTVKVTPIKLSLSIFIVIALLVSIKDIKDYKGDRDDNIKTLFTIFGLKKGKYIIAIIISFIIILLPIIFQLWNFIYVAAVFVIINFLLILFDRYKERYLFIIYFIYFIIFMYFLIPQIN